MSDIVISVENLSKRYLIGHETAQRESYTALRDVIVRETRTFARKAVDMFSGRQIVQGDETEEIWALRNVSFEVERGEVIGIIGRNGAGKSTLLKVLSRITEPSEGRVRLRGRVGSLLEVGTGFHPELTGRENIYLNGAILGMTHAEIGRKFDEIVAFAEVERFLDTPVKRYSSGMYVRLAFAVAAHLEPDILLVDEVLAVGDMDFQRKSLGKMGDVAKGGRTVLFVSHNLGAIRRLCAHAFVFEGGKLAFGGNVDAALRAYERVYRGSSGLAADAKFQGRLADEIRFDQIICIQGGAVVSLLDPACKLVVEVRGFAFRPFQGFELTMSIFRDGIHIAACQDTSDATPLCVGPFVSRFDFPADTFRPGIYTIGLSVAELSGRWAWGSEVGALDFSENTGGRPVHRYSGVVGIPYTAQRIQSNFQGEVTASAF